MQVHESQIIGELGKGYKYAIEVLNIGRIGIGAQVSTLFKKISFLVIIFSYPASLGDWDDFNCMHTLSL